MSGADAQWRYIDVDGISTRYRESGSGPAIVFAHGGEWGSGGGFTWPDELFDDLDPHYRVVAVDRLGQGHTDNPPTEDGYRMKAVVDHFAAFLRTIDATDVTLVGQSRGGYVVSRTAKEYPELVSRVVIINSGSVSVRYPAEPVPGLRTYDVYSVATGDVRADAALMSVTTEHITDAWVAERDAAQNLPKSAEAREIGKRVKEQMYREFEAEKADTLKWMISGGLTKPVLLIWGVGDRTLTSRDGIDLFDVLAPHNPRLRAKFINRSGHWPHREYPHEVAAEIGAFVAAN